ncbi:MAG: hypothetical protein IKI01_08205, partial [Lachnospiraceae bacterium]|nr:hypothetical protein [Lachnospiraceae bacterium]
NNNNNNNNGSNVAMQALGKTVDQTAGTITFQIRKTQGNDTWQLDNVVITRDENNNYVISGLDSALQYLIGNTQGNIDPMPGFPWQSSFTLTDVQLDWLKNYYGIDVTAELPPVEINNDDPNGGDTPSGEVSFVQNTSAPYSSMVKESDHSDNAIYFELDWYGSRLPIRVTKTATGYKLIVTTTGNQWLLGDMNQSGVTYSAMPGYGWSTSEYNDIGPNVIKWFKDNFGVDINASFGA